MLPFYLVSFEESPESYLAPSRGAVWGYPAVGTIHGASGVLYDMYETLWFGLASVND